MLPPLPYLPCSLQGVLLPKEGYLILRGASRLDAFSVYPFQTWLLCHAVGRQQIHQWSVHPGPLVLRTAPLKYPPPAPDRDRTVSRRSEPSSRTALMGEQPNPWDLLQPQDAMSRHRGAKPLRRCELLGVISLLSQGSFYPLSDGNPTLYHRITKSYFRTCSTRRCRSQAPFCLCTLQTVSNHSEGTFERLRYPFGGDRPSQTPRLTLSHCQFMATG